MTLQEFFAIAKQAKWQYTNDGDLRTYSVPCGRSRKTGDLCPLAYVTLAVTGRAHWMDEPAAEALDLEVPAALAYGKLGNSPTALAAKIISGADYASVDGKRNQNRRWLARGLGIWKR